MIRHVCIFKFKDFAGGKTKADNIAITKTMLDKLPDTIPYILRSETHIGSADQPGDNFDLILISDFESFETLEKYKVNPEHVAVGKFMSDVRESRTCIDFEI